jgi:hypothetical protein
VVGAVSWLLLLATLVRPRAREGLAHG